MPYSIQTADDITIDGIPDSVAPDAPELRQRVARLRMQRRLASPEAQAEREAQRAAEYDRLMHQNVADMSLPERWAANWSAGYGNLAQGIDQLLGKVGIGRGVSDEDIAEKRRRDAYLARNWGDKAMQLGGEVVPMMGLPAGAVSRPVAALGGTTLGPTSQLLLSGAGGGAASSALAPVTSDESRPMNAAIGATLGMAIPGAGAAVPAAWRGGRKLLTDAGAQQRALDYIAEHLGDPSEALLAKLGARKPPTLRGAPVEVPTSAAQATGDPRLAQLEAYSRSKPGTQPDWADFDTARNAGNYELLHGMAPSELRMSRLERVRAGRTAPQREAALAQAAQQGNFAEPVLAHVDNLLQGEAGAIPAVQSLGRYVQGAIGPEAFGAVTPQRLYTVRKVLADKLGGRVMPGDELGAAAKAARAETMGVIKAIDDALDAGSGNQWSAYLRGYAERSRPITSGRALTEVAEKIDAKPLRGNTPEVTYAGMRTAARATEGKFGDKLLPEARTDFDNFMDSLRSAEAASRTRKLAATMGGGSITNTDQMLAAGLRRFIEALPGVGGYAGRIRELNSDLVERELAKLLQSPTQLGAALRALPEQRRAEVLDEALRASGMAAGAEVGQ